MEMMNLEEGCRKCNRRRQIQREDSGPAVYRIFSQSDSHISSHPGFLNSDVALKTLPVLVM